MKFGSISPSIFFFFFKLVLAILFSLSFYIKFKFSLLIFTKEILLGFLLKFFEPLDQFWENWHLQQHGIFQTISTVYLFIYLDLHWFLSLVFLVFSLQVLHRLCIFIPVAFLGGFGGFINVTCKFSTSNFSLLVHRRLIYWYL